MDLSWVSELLEILNFFPLSALCVFLNSKLSSLLKVDSTLELMNTDEAITKINIIANG